MTNLGNPTDALDIRGNYFWHTDKSYEVPSLTTMLHAVEVPLVGGHSQFANMMLAYRGLSQALKDELVGLRAIHGKRARSNPAANRRVRPKKRERPPVPHSIVRTHPETGDKALYIGNHAATVEGMPETEGCWTSYWSMRRNLNVVYTHHWRPGAVVIWDNRALLHRAVANYEMGRHRRVLHRTRVRGTIPY